MNKKDRNKINYFLLITVLSTLLTIISCTGKRENCIENCKKNLNITINEQKSDFNKNGFQDGIAPINMSEKFINLNQKSTSLKVVTLSLNAVDNQELKSYYASEEPTTPSPTSLEWKYVEPVKYLDLKVPFNLSEVNGSKNIYLWFIDSAGNISNMSSDDIILSIEDTIAPENKTSTQFINNGDVNTSSPLVQLSLSATEVEGSFIDKYYISENPEIPLSSDQSWIGLTTPIRIFEKEITYQLSSGDGEKTVYVWFIDLDENISLSINDTINLTTDDSTSPASMMSNNFINNGELQTDKRDVSISLYATDEIGITGYYVSEEPTSPIIVSSNWRTVSQKKSFNKTIIFTLSKELGEKTLYVWFMDSAGNLSEVIIDKIELIPDIVPPDNITIDDFINFGDRSVSTISVSLRISAKDNYKVTGYYISEESITPPIIDDGWVPIENEYGAEFHLNVPYWLSGGSGEKIVYVWFKDAAGLISEFAADSVTLYTMLKVPDSGQSTLPFTNGENEYGPFSYDDIVGEDADYSINPPSLQKNDDLTITDNITGLKWQEYSPEATMTWHEGRSYCEELNLGGLTDWRLPARMELLSIANYGTYDPAIDIQYFPNTKSEVYWADTNFMYSSGSSAWEVFFYTGRSGHGREKGELRYVRCVQGGLVDVDFTGGIKYVDHNNGTVTDNETGIMWIQEDMSPRNWESAISFCEKLTLGGYSDWRLPNFREQATLVDSSRYVPSIDSIYFPNTDLSPHWSSTTYPPTPSRARGVDFTYGSVMYMDKQQSLFFRCIREGRSGKLIPK